MFLSLKKVDKIIIIYLLKRKIIIGVILCRRLWRSLRVMCHQNNLPSFGVKNRSFFVFELRVCIDEFVRELQRFEKNHFFLSIS